MVRALRILIFIVAFFAMFMSCRSASAQVDQAFETGLNPYRSYQTGNIDTISLWARQLNVDIPIISYPQRGGKLQLNFVLHYANLGEWNDTNCSPSPCSYTASGNYPNTGFGVIQAGSLSNAGGTCGTYAPNTQDELCSYNLTLADGSTSTLSPTNNTTWKSTDLRGFQLSNFTENEFGTDTLLTDRNGISYEGNSAFPPGNLLPLFSYAIFTNPPGQMEDANGNEITYQPYGSGLSPGIGWTDTVGRNIPLPVSTSASSCPQTPLVPDSAFLWNFPGVNGGTYRVTFCYAEVAYNIVNVPGYLSSGNLDELQSVILPNGTAWTFQYTTDGNVDLSKITFPTGATLSYTWNPTQNYPDGCAVHSYTNSRSVVTRTLTANSTDSPSATWTYGGASGGRVIVTDPLLNDTAHTFTDLRTNSCPFYETTTQYFQGSYTAGTLLKTVNTAFTPLQPAANVGQPGTVNVTWPNGQENQTSITYDSAVIFQSPIFNITTHALAGPPNSTPWSYGLPLTKKEYDYGTSPSFGSLLKTTTINYEALVNSNYLLSNRLDLPSSVVVTGAGPGSTTTYVYDTPSTLQPSFISTQRISPPSGGNYRGNPTTVSRYLNTTGTNLNTTSSFYDTGMPYIVTDPNGNQTTLGYSSAYAGGSLTSVENAKSQITTFTYDFNTGLQTSTTDPNTLTTNNTYDQMERPTLVTNPDGGQVAYTYNDASPSPSVDINITANSSGALVKGGEILDGLGRLKQKQLTSDPSGADFTDYTYDALGRASTISNPYRGSPPNPNLLTTFAYDALGRNTNTTEADGSIQQAQYCGSGTLTIDEAGIWKRTISDGLGRISEADEPTSSSSTKNACAGQGGPVYATTYNYDVNGNVTGVLQAGSRQRSFVYDSLARLTSSTNPEANTEAVSPFTPVATTYTYDGDGNVISKTSPAPNQQGTTTQTISYCYDPLNRATQKAYTAQSCPMSAPLVTYAYDASGSGTVNIGRRTGMTEASGGSESWSYKLNTTTSPKGLLVTDTRVTNAITKTSAYQYNYDGSLGLIQYPSGRTVTYAYNGAAQQTAATDVANSIGYVSNGVYAPNGAVTTRSLGARINHTNIYNSRLQPCWTYVTSGTALPASTSCTAPDPGPGNILDFKYGFNVGTADNGNVINVANYRDDTRSQDFTYDTLNRLATAYTYSTYSTSPANCWGEQFGYDTTGNWGNLLTISPVSSAYTGCTQESLSATVSAYNRITTLTYDSAGNTTTIPGTGGGSYTFNAENLLASTAGTTYTYDGDNERVETSGSTLYWYGPDGTFLTDTDTTGSVTNGSSHDFIYFNGERVARRDSAGDAFYLFNDQIGSVRAIAEIPSGQTTATLCLDTDYYPFGTQRSPIVSSCTSNLKFTGNHLDQSSLYEANARYYASFEGRFMSPDPLGVDAADLSNPQKWNLYSYVGNSPLVFIDPTGLSDCDAGDEPTCTPGALTEFGGPFFADPQQSSQEPYLEPGTIQVITNQKLSADDPRLHSDYCQTSDQLCKQQLARILDDLRWTSVFAKTFIGGFSFKSIGRDLRDPRSCLSQFVDQQTPENIWDTTATQDAVHDSAAILGVKAAMNWAEHRALPVPLRSSIVRGFVGTGERVNTAFAVYGVAMETKAFIDEMKSLRNGTCY
jgi:RHS repeat-associated protein